jgi:fermentation-respiration switch protein FrsA (DUF1100 family)
MATSSAATCEVNLRTDDGIDLAAVVRRPQPAGPRATRWAAVVLTGPFTGVKEQVTGLYARRLTDAGYVTLVLDHRGFGASGGRRAHEDSQGKLTDLRAAVTHLQSADGVDPDRIGVVGICLGGGYALRAAASDPRLKVVAAVAGGYNGPVALAKAMGVQNYRAALAGFLADYDTHVPAVATGGGQAAMAGDEPWEYYGTPRSAGGAWENRVTRGSLHSLMTFDALGAVDLLGETPLLIVHGRADAYCSPELAEQVYQRATGPKQIVWLDAERHIDLYDTEPFVGQAVAAVVEHLNRYLAAAVTSP